MGTRTIEQDDLQDVQVPAELLIQNVRANRDTLAYQLDFANARIQLLEQQVADLMKEKE
jgi:hypothetical protein